MQGCCTFINQAAAAMLGYLTFSDSPKGDDS
jgi:hypothetical protein